MVEEVWLHVGSAKSGTSSLQKYLHSNQDMLSDRGVAYIALGRKATINDLVISFNKKREDLDNIREHIGAQIASRPEKVAVLSSEMLFGFPPARIFDLLPVLRERPLNVLVYLRRQDRYIEAVYLQKAKNARFVGSLQDYVDRFRGSGSDYHAGLSAWEGTDATLVPRVMERPKLVGGSVVPDALAQMGVQGVDVEEERDTNVSPGSHRVQLLQAAASVGFADPRKLQRRLAAQYPQQPSERRSVLSQEGRRAYLANFAAGNEAIRAKYFPGMDTLFDESDLKTDQAEEGIAPYTPAQLEEIRRIFEIAKTFS